MAINFVKQWTKIFQGHNKTVVVFRNGSCVVFVGAEDDYQQRAIELMKEYGPVQVGGAAGDFSVVELKDAAGWAVTSHHNDILTYVGPSEVSQHDDLTVGLYGRNKRDLDAKSLEILSVVEAH